MKFDYSFIIPVYNRPQEIKELLDSFLKLQFNDSFEIVIIEDGSSLSAEDCIKQYDSKLQISYYFKENSGPGDSRNYGMKRAKGNYFIILDSDCILPSHYLKTVDNFLKTQFIHCYGGADASHNSFSDIQKAISFVMTSFITTGGIRGSKKSISTFEPRSFNMGISKEAFQKTGGFGNIHPGEDPDLSQRVKQAGYQTAFISNAFVFHKRRISWSTFYTQVKKFGLVRPILNLWHPKEAKITYWFPSLFVIFTIISSFLAILFNTYFLIPFLAYLMVILINSSIVNKNLKVGFLSVFAVLVQFFGYGMAFLKSFFLIHILKRKPEIQFPQLFFKTIS
ncbi:MAG: glycosyltransferase [Flavobacteriales bacterium]